MTETALILGFMIGLFSALGMMCIGIKSTNVKRWIEAGSRKVYLGAACPKCGEELAPLGTAPDVNGMIYLCKTCIDPESNINIRYVLSRYSVVRKCSVKTVNDLRVENGKEPIE